MRREVKYKIKGMTKDYSNSAFSPEFSFDNRNIRITTLEGNTTLSIVNEKGTKQLNYTCYNKDGDIIGLDTIIGYCVVNNILVLFTTGDGDSIHKAVFEDEDSLEIKRLFHGNLEFDFEHKIETLGIYENENNIKVYWVDGINQPRVINIADDPNNYTKNSFDFVPKVSNIGESDFIVTKNYSIGTFPSGVIQYCYTYYNKNGQETNILDVSPLFYTTNSDRGGSPEETVTNSFNIDIYAPNREFEFIRIYSILRTSLNATPLCKVVADLEITEGDINIIDTGNLGYTIDPTNLLYVGGEIIKAGTLNQKDNTLFLGNISVEKLDAGGIELSSRMTVEESLQVLSDENLKFSTSDEGDDTDFKLRINNGSTGEYPYRNQLDGNSREFKIFKRGETYRCGLQFQHATGKWSSPIWLKDIKNDIKPSGYYDTEAPIEVTTGKPVFTLDNESIINSLIEEGYKAVRPVVVYPTDADRDIICQGVINPTVFNVKDRQDGTTYAQASWFFRPRLPYAAIDVSEYPDKFKDFNDDTKYSSNSIAGIIGTQQSYTVNDEKITLKDAWTEFRHNYYIPHNREPRAEIQCIEQYPKMKVVNLDTPLSGPPTWYEVEEVVKIEGNEDLNHFPELYVIDSSLVTLNSPEVELGKINTGLLKNTRLNYIGIIPITGNLQDADIISSTAPITNNTGYTGKGFMPSLINQIETPNRLAGRRKLAGTLWVDFTSPNDNNEYSFITYPWHRSGSLNMEREAEDGYRSAMLQNQKRSTLFYSSNSIYLDYNNFISYTPESPILSNDGSFNYLQYGTGEGKYEEVIYKGNVSSIVLPEMTDANVQSYEYKGDSISGGVQKGDRVQLVKKGDIVRHKSNGYYIVKGPSDTGNMERGRYLTKQVSNYGKDPVEIKYKSTPHVVLDHGYLYDSLDKKYKKYISPHIFSINNDADDNLYFSDNINPSNSDVAFPFSVGYSWLWLAELVREIPADIKFGGTSKQAIENNQWVVAGDTYKLENNINIVWKEGDHYYQRYDCLKTYPYTMEDTNSVVEMLSFMCETRVNLDGRYDRNRGKTNNLVMTPNNFNLMNPVYDQQNNFFNYRVAEKQYQEINDYLNAITWSKTKTFGEKVDTWTNITLASTLELDGNKGRVESIKRLNNDLIAFQERGISQILYNDNVQISTQSGVPVEIANSGKVQGKRYLSSYVGCNNKWSICESPAGLYFIDENTKGIYLFNGNLTNLSDKLGFSSWAKDNLKDNNFISYYDPIESEVLFLNNKECLTYSERLGTFTSFYDYTSNTIPINMGDRTLLVGDPLGESELKFYEYHAGKYNDFYGTEDSPIYKPFSISLVVNPEPTKDKIFNTVEFRADAFDTEGQYLESIKPFSNIQVKNEYQDTGDISLDDINLRKKFRIWRHTIQRDWINRRDRIRNPWATITLKNENPEDNKVVLHDVVISYFD